MNWSHKKKQNEKLMDLYMASLEHETLTYEQRLKLATEIGRLNKQNQWIEGMLVEDFFKDCMVHNVQQTSIL